MRAVKAQLLVKANTALFHRPALVAESLSLSSGTMAFLHSAPDMSLCRQKNRERAGVKQGPPTPPGALHAFAFFYCFEALGIFELLNSPLHTPWKSCDLIVMPLL